MLIIPIIYFYFHGHQILKVASISFFYNFCFPLPEFSKRATTATTFLLKPR